MWVEPENHEPTNKFKFYSWIIFISQLLNGSFHLQIKVFKVKNCIEGLTIKRHDSDRHSNRLVK